MVLSLWNLIYPLQYYFNCINRWGKMVIIQLFHVYLSCKTIDGRVSRFAFKREISCAKETQCIYDNWKIGQLFASDTGRVVITCITLYYFDSKRSPSMRVCESAVIQLWTLACQYHIIMGLLFMTTCERKRKRAAAPKRRHNFLFLQNAQYFCMLGRPCDRRERRWWEGTHNLASFAAIIVPIAHLGRNAPIQWAKWWIETKLLGVSVFLIFGRKNLFLVFFSFILF